MMIISPKWKMEMSEEELQLFEKHEKGLLDMIADGRLQEISKPDIPTFAIVVYYDDEGKICHSGKITVGSFPKVKSIWVNRHHYLLGQVMTHPLWHVPKEFGTTVKYYFPGPNLSEVWDGRGIECDPFLWGD